MSFQSLARSVSSQARASSDSADGVEGISGRRVGQDAPSDPTPDSQHDRAAQHQGQLAAVATGKSDNPGTTAGNPGRTTSDPEADLGKAGNPRGLLEGLPTEKKWAYPMPSGSPMFERRRSRNQDQEALFGEANQTGQLRSDATTAAAAADAAAQGPSQAEAVDRSVCSPGSKDITM